MGYLFRYPYLIFLAIDAAVPFFAVTVKSGTTSVTFTNTAINKIEFIVNISHTNQRKKYVRQRIVIFLHRRTSYPNSTNENKYVGWNWKKVAIWLSAYRAASLKSCRIAKIVHLRAEKRRHVNVKFVRIG